MYSYRACKSDEEGVPLSDLHNAVNDLFPVQLLTTIQNKLHRDMHEGILLYSYDKIVTQFV